MKKMTAFVLAALLLVSGCTSTELRESDYDHMSSIEAPDGSPSKLTSAQVVAAAQEVIAKKKGWERWLGRVPAADGWIYTVSYENRRINQGGWRVVAKKGNCDPDARVFVRDPDAGPGVIMEFDEAGRLKRMSR